MEIKVELSEAEALEQCRFSTVWSKSSLKLSLARHRMGLHGKGGRSKKMKSSECSDKREVAEA